MKLITFQALLHLCGKEFLIFPSEISKFFPKTVLLTKYSKSKKIQKFCTTEKGKNGNMLRVTQCLFLNRKKQNFSFKLQL